MFCAIFTIQSLGADLTGQFDPGLVANKADHERIVLKLVARDKIKGAFEVAEGAHMTASRLIDPRTQKSTVIVLLVEQRGELPFVYVDLNGDDSLSPDEKLTLKPSLDDNPYLWEITAELKMKEGFFKTCPIYIRYFKSVKTEKMTPTDRLITQSTEVMARGRVEVKGKPVIFQYAYDAEKNKVNPQSGYLGVDSDGNGVVDFGTMSPESTKANDETVVFRVGDSYVATKKADVGKNQIIVAEREAKDYKRQEVHINKEFPEFSFTDFEGKKRKFSEFRGKWVLLDVWGFWCGPCRVELPYIREAHRRFGARNFEVLGLNTDEDFTVDSMKKALKDAGMTWSNAQFSSVVSFLREGLRVNSFPTTFLIDPQGKVVSISRTDRDELDLRGRDLLESLDKTLPAF
jgi:peroxiredoxin